ncbi:adenosine receptor A2a-like [Oculina patagonica]
MTSPLCDELLLYQATDTEAKDLYSSYIVNIVLNAVLSITAIMFNSVTIQAIRRTSSLSKPLKTLLLSLAVSDVGVGLLCHPFNIVFLEKWTQQNTENSPSCTAYTVFAFVVIQFSSVSFFGVTALSVDRFLAIHLHLRYQELVTYKRVVAAVISMWVLATFLSLFRLWVSTDITYVVFAIIVVVFLALSAALYCKIYSAVRRHRNQIQALQVQQVAQHGEEKTNFARLRKSALGTFYVYLVFLACYLPQSCSLAFITIYGSNSATKGFSIYSATLLYLNSSLNPVIYCWKMRHVRHAIMDILRNVFPTQG